MLACAQDGAVWPPGGAHEHVERRHTHSIWGGEGRNLGWVMLGRGEASEGWAGLAGECMGCLPPVGGMRLRCQGSGAGFSESLGKTLSSESFKKEIFLTHWGKING